VFFRTGFLNHNLIVGYVAAAGFVAVWNPAGDTRWPRHTRAVLGGAAGGLAVLLDYTGAVMLIGLMLYGALRSRSERPSSGLVSFSAWFGAGALGPLLLLWFYQWTSFGDPFQPAQRWMPEVAWAESGYRGFSFPMPDLLAATLFDYRYGLFVSCPLALLALAAPWVDRGRLLPRRETLFVLALFVAFTVFCAGINYGRLQFNTGIRYMTAMLPFLFVAAAVVLVRLPWAVRYGISVGSLALSWSLAMHRDVERGFGVPGAVMHTVIGGFELPALTTISRMGGTFGEIVERGVSPLPLFALTAAALYGVWRIPTGRLRGV
jgi:hypothetical protein